jgi:hypothetical protein
VEKKETGSVLSISKADRSFCTQWSLAFSFVELQLSLIQCDFTLYETPPLVPFLSWNLKRQNVGLMAVTILRAVVVNSESAYVTVFY